MGVAQHSDSPTPRESLAPGGRGNGRPEGKGCRCYRGQPRNGQLGLRLGQADLEAGGEGMRRGWTGRWLTDSGAVSTGLWDWQEGERRKCGEGELRDLGEGAELSGLK